MLVAVERLEEGRSTQSLARRYESLIRLANAIRSQHDLEDLFQVLAAELQNVVPFDAMAQCDHTGNKVHWHLSTAIDSALSRLSEIPKEETVGWSVHRTQQPVVIQVSEAETRFRTTIERLRILGLRSLCAVPLSTAHQQLGSLVFSSQIADAYPPDEVKFLSLVSGQIALAMDYALNFQRLKLLLELTNSVVSKLHLRELLREVSAGIRRVMQCDAAGVVLPNPETGQLSLYAVDFPCSKSGIREGFTITADTGAGVESVFRTGQAVIATKAEINSSRVAIADGTNSLCHLPLMGRDRVLGALSLSSTREGAFSQADVTFLCQAANQIALAIENALAFGEIASLKD